MKTTKRFVAMLLVAGVAVLLCTTVSTTALMVIDPAKTEQVEKSADQLAVVEVDVAADTAKSSEAEVDTAELVEIGSYSVDPDTAWCIEPPEFCGTNCPLGCDGGHCCANHLACCNQSNCTWTWTCCSKCEGLCACM